MTRTMIFALALALAAPAMGAAAAPQDEAVAIRVSAAGLDLSREPDARRMLQRLRRASLQACGASSFSVSDYRRTVEQSACYRESLDRAVVDLGAPAVGQLYREQGAVSVASN